MNLQEVESLARALGGLPLATLLMLVLVGGYRGWWIYGTAHDKLVGKIEKDRDEWKSLALEVSGLAHSVVRKLGPGQGGTP